MVGVSTARLNAWILRGLAALTTAVLAAYTLYEAWHDWHDGGEGSPLDLIVASAGAVVVTVGFRRARNPARAALLAALVSGLTTVAVEAGRAAGYHQWSPRVAESFWLLVLVTTTLRRVVRPRAWWLAAGLGGALLATYLNSILWGWGLSWDGARPAPAVAALVSRDSFVEVVQLGSLLAVAAVLGAYLRAADAERSGTLEAARHWERLALAYDLHDLTAHQLTAIVLRAQAARAAGDPPDAHLAAAALADIEQAGAQALGSIRRFARQLRHPEEAAPLVTRLPDAAELAAELGGDAPRVRLEIAPELATVALPAEVTTTVHRLVRESLTNVRRHAADAEHVEVRIGHDGGRLYVTVRDDGRGRAPRFAGGAGIGLTGLTERVAAVGGRLAAGPCPGGGWQVQATVPIPGAVR